MKVTYGEKGVPSLELVIHLWRPPMGKKCSTHELEWWQMCNWCHDNYWGKWVANEESNTTLNPLQLLGTLQECTKSATSNRCWLIFMEFTINIIPTFVLVDNMPPHFSLRKRSHYITLDIFMLQDCYLKCMYLDWGGLWNSSMRLHKDD